MAGAFVWNILDEGVFKERKDIYCPGTIIPLTNITEMPVYLFAGGNDPLAPYGNSVRLSRELGDCRGLDLEPDFNHYDFV